MDDQECEASPNDVVLRELFEVNMPLNEREHLARRAITELWHFASCPMDHCERCIEQERFIKLVRDTIPAWHR